MKKNLIEISSKLNKILPVIYSKYKVNSLEIFGSYVRNEQNNESDLDLLISFFQTPGLITFLELKNYLTDYLQIEVDLVMKDTLKPQLKNSILSEAISI